MSTNTPSSTEFNFDQVSIVASDLDGTLLLPNHSLGEQTKQTLHQLHQQGYTFVFATGRHHVDVATFRQNAGIPAYMITSNGARVHSPQDELLYSKNIAAELVQPIVDVLKHDHELTLHIYRSEDWLTNKADRQLSEHHKQSGFGFGLFELDAAPYEDVCKLFFTHPEHEHLVQYENKLNQMFAGQITVAFSTPNCLEVMAPQVSKGDALQAVAELLGKQLQHCLAFGDGMNDVEMLSMAGKGLVMETSHIKVKQALPNNEVIGSSHDQAVAHYLQQHLL